MDLRLFSIYPNNFEKNTWQNERNLAIHMAFQIYNIP